MACYQLRWAGLGLAIAAAGCLSQIATPEVIAQAEETFATHRDEFNELATTAITDLQQSSGSQLRLPDRPFYETAWAAKTLNGDAIVIDFVIEEFYVPLVYVSTDDPQDVHDTCSNGGQVVKQLEPHWYICQRDWN